VNAIKNNNIPVEPKDTSTTPYILNAILLWTIYGIAMPHKKQK
jgi:hypothetical protein